jgi:peptidoglycan hydrolase-like protein with peptidoglycan-binding domain
MLSSELGRSLGSDEGAAKEFSPRSRVGAARTVGIVVAIAIVAWVGGSRIKSARQIAAEAAEPTPTAILETVRYARLTDTIVLTGTVAATRPAEIRAPHVPGVLHQIYTRAPSPVGDQVFEGDLLFELSGRPVFALIGRIPLYRSISLGLTGGDVTQLQAALGRLGYQTGDRGVFGRSDADALAHFYRDRGYDPPSAADGPLASPVELVFTRTLPAEIIDAGAALGHEASGRIPALTLSAGGVRILARLTGDEASRVIAGSPATVEVAETGRSMAARVTSVADVGEVDAIGSIGFRVVVETKAKIDPRLLGKDVTLQIRGGVTGSRALIVPLSAIWSRANGQTYVTRVTVDGQHPVAVELGRTGDGLVQIVPFESSLQEGDRVLVGKSTLL